MLLNIQLRQLMKAFLPKLFSLSDQNFSIAIQGRTGGFDGFYFDDDRTEEVYYYKGGHGEPLAKENQTSILAFTLDGDPSHPSNLLELSQISAKFQWISRAAPYFVLLLLPVVLCVTSLWVWWIFQGFAWDRLAFWLKFTISIAIVYFAYALAKTG